MTFTEWEREVPQEIKSDTVWRVEAYRLSLFLADVAWIDSDPLFGKSRTSSHSDQLRRASSRISSSICEGYSRDTGKARATFYEYAVGSARETRDWYFKARRALRPKVVAHRVDLATQIIKLCLKMVSNERRTNRRAGG